MYFPRLIIPIAPLFVGLVDFGVACILLIGMMLFYGIVPGVAVFTVQLFVLLAVITALTVGLWLSALNVQYRDVRYTIPFLTQLWLFASPVAYPSSLLPEPWRTEVLKYLVEITRWLLVVDVMRRPARSTATILPSTCSGSTGQSQDAEASPRRMSED